MMRLSTLVRTLVFCAVRILSADIFHKMESCSSTSSMRTIFPAQGKRIPGLSAVSLVIPFFLSMLRTSLFSGLSDDRYYLRPSPCALSVVATTCWINPHSTVWSPWWYRWQRGLVPSASGFMPGDWWGRNPLCPYLLTQVCILYRQEPHCSSERFVLNSSINYTIGLRTTPSAPFAPDEFIGRLWTPRAGFIGQNRLTRLIFPLVQNALYELPCCLYLVTACKER